MIRLLAWLTWLLVRLALSFIFYVTPLLGFWLAASLAAYLGGPPWMAWTAGALLFPVIPGVWELRAWAYRDPKRKAWLTPLDRLGLRTFAVGLAFLAVLLYFYPKTAFVALSTRGDWMLDGVKDPRADKARRVLFATAGGLEWLYRATNSNPYKSEIDSQARQQAEEATQQREQEMAQDAVKEEFSKKDQEQKPQQTAHEVAEENDQHAVQIRRLDKQWPWKNVPLHPAVAAMPASVETSIQSVARYIANHEKNPVQRIKALHDYVADRVAYDSVALFSNKFPPQDAQTVFRTRKSVCAGYANLLSALAAAINEKIIVVEGDARDPTTGDKLTGSGHAWNAARIGGRWYLLDACWDSGYVSREQGFTKHYNTEYFLPPPEVMIQDHFPERPTWQLLAKPLSQGEFLRQPMLEPSFQAADLTLISPTRARNESGAKALVIVKNPDHHWLMASLEQKGKQIGDSCPATNSDTAQLERSLPDKGTYRLNIYINKESEYGSYDSVGAVDFVNR